MQLKIKQELFRLPSTYTITDESEEVVFQAKAKLFSLHAIRHLYSASGEVLYTIRAKLFRFLPEFELIDANGNKIATIKKKFSFLQNLAIQTKDGTYRIKGDFWSLNYKIEKDEGVVAEVQKKLISIRDSYTLDIYDPQVDAAFLVAFTLIIDLLLDRKKK